jgi:2,4-dienoyl-CoA reductase (NADPH2)
MEAARVAALRGHKVTLFERRSTLGGGVELWSRIPGREHLGTLRNWYDRQLEEFGVDVRNGVDADEATILRQRPQAVVIATGSRYAPAGQSGFQQTPIDGWDQDFVITPEAVLEGDLRLQGRVVVLDEEGLHAAAGVAELAAKQGASVEYVTRGLLPARGLASNSQLGYAVSRMRNAGVVVSTSHYIRRIGDKRVTLFETWTKQERTVKVDWVVLATMRVPVDTLSGGLQNKVERVYLIGDALAPRLLREATYEGHRFARAIGEPGGPANVDEALFEPMEGLRSAALA